MRIGQIFEKLPFAIAPLGAEIADRAPAHNLLHRLILAGETIIGLADADPRPDPFIIGGQVAMLLADLDAPLIVMTGNGDHRPDDLDGADGVAGGIEAVAK